MPSPEALRRPAAVVTVGGFRPTRDPFATQFGLPPLTRDEPWPVWNGRPLAFICQLNLTQAPVVPARLADIALITLFVDENCCPSSRENGKDWCLRAYRSLDELRPARVPDDAARLERGFECRWMAVSDFPPRAGPGFPNVSRTKIGGYASELQGEPWWDLWEPEDESLDPGPEDFRPYPGAPEFCLQVDSEPKAGLSLGAGGMIAIARGTAPGFEDQWYLDLQLP